MRMSMGSFNKAHTLADIIAAKQYFATDEKLVDCPIALKFLEIVNSGYVSGLKDDLNQTLIVDSKVCQLMEGMYPCIPGWHFDEVKRDENGQLDWENNEHDKRHYMMILDWGTGSLTEFYRPHRGYYDLKRASGIKDYTQLNQEISDDLNNNRRLKLTETVESGVVYEFNCLNAHRGTPAKGNGWRYFIRATLLTQRPFFNQIRTQTQVYLPQENLEKGW